VLQENSEIDDDFSNNGFFDDGLDSVCDDNGISVNQVPLDIETSSNGKGRSSKNMKGGGRQTKIYDLVKLSKLKEPIRSKGTKKSVGIVEKQKSVMRSNKRIN
jgi:hypothetical protein